MNQIPERISREHQLGVEPRMHYAVHHRLPITGVPTLCFRLGKSLRDPPHSPRRPVELLEES
jgi:hypothetical protein